MINNKYKTGEDLIATRISSGRSHHSYRLPIRSTTTYIREIVYGENYHTLSAVIFGTDEYWWVISDMNKPIKAFALKTGDKVNLPENIVRSRSGVNNFV